MAEAPRPKKEEQLPASEDVTEVAPGVLRLQLPIQMTGLGHVNMYALLDDRGAAIVDPGMPGPQSWRHVPKRLAAAGLKMRDVHTVLITHSHPDHFGGAAQLAEEAGAAVVTHAAFRTWHDANHTHDDAKESVAGADAAEAPSEDEEAGGAHGHAHHDHRHDASPYRPAYNPRPVPDRVVSGGPWGGPLPWAPGAPVMPPRDRRQMMKDMPLRRRLQFQATELLGSRVGTKVAGSAMRRFMKFPTVTTRMEGGDVIKLAGREWIAVHTPGHTADHLCLYDPEGGQLLSGDHVLPTITPHIGGISPLEDALGEFYESLDRVAALPGVTQVLPAHGHPFPDIVARVDAIKEHHEERLMKLREVAAELGPQPVSEFSHHLFRQERWGQMAESETYADLEHLKFRGLAEVHEENGFLIYDLEHPPA